MTIEHLSHYDTNYSATKFELHLQVNDKDITAIDLIAANIVFSRQKIKQIMQNGAVWLTQIHHNTNTTKRIRRAKKMLSVGQTLHCYYDEDIYNQVPLKPDLIADEQDYSVWFKPVGMLSQGSKYGDHCALYRWVEMHLKPQRNAFIVHRLDKATSGLMLIAHSKKAAARLSELFARGEINKFYKAIIYGSMSSEMVLPIILNEDLDNKSARTRVLHCQQLNSSCLADNQTCSLLDIQILTGRKHQIRQHLSQIGHPIIGDRLYGSGDKDGYNLCLTAYKTTFLSPFDTLNKHYELDSSYYPSL